MSTDSGDDSSVELQDTVVDMLQKAIHHGGSDSGIGDVEFHPEPKLIVTEQPQGRGFRFRYDSEGASHGGLQGINSSKDGKTYPTVQILNYKGPARIAVSLVTVKNPPKPHVHELFGKNCENGTCVVSMKESPEMKAVFSNLGVSHIKKKNVPAVLTRRIQNNMLQAKLLTQATMEGYNPILTEEEKNIAKQEAQELSKNMQLNMVRLCFRAYLMDQSGMFTRVLSPAYTTTIFDSKSPGAAALKICRMDKHAGSCVGNDEVFLLCDKVQKDDISVRFFEDDPNSGMIKWENHANFGPADVHRQYAIVFKTPPYYDKNIHEPVKVFVQLRRLSDHESSEPKIFTYYPQELDAEQVNRKRKKSIFPNYNIGQNEMNTGFNRFGGGPSAGSTGGGAGFNGGTYQTSSNKAAEDSLFHMQQAHYATSLPSVDHFFTNLLPRSSTSPNRDTLGASSEYNTTESHMIARDAMGAAMPTDITEDGDNRYIIKHDPADPVSYSYPSEGRFQQQPVCTSKQDEEKNIDLELVLDSGFRSESLKADDAVSITVDLDIVKQEDVKKEEIVIEHPHQKTDPEAPHPKLENSPGMQTNNSSNFHTPVQPAQSISSTSTTEINSPLEKSLVDYPDVLAWSIASKLSLGLQNFAKTSDVSCLLQLLRYLIPVSDDLGDSSLNQAIIHKQVEACLYLLDAMSTIPNNPALNQQNYIGQYPLHLAVITNQPLLVETLLAKGCDRCVTDRYGNTASHLAVQLNHSECLIKLLTRTTSLSHMTAPFPDINILNYEGSSPLHLATWSGSLDLVKHLVQAGAQVDMADGKSGRTALHMAVEFNYIHIVGYLVLEAQVDVNVATFDGNTALHLATGNSMLGVTALLVTAGADIQAENYEPFMFGDGERQISCSEDETDPENKGSPYERGHTPYDLATSEEITRLLEGESYHTVRPLSNANKYTCTQTQHGDMYKLGLSAREKLARMLNVQNDWWQLAELVGLKDLVPVLSQSHDSPAKELLDNYEALDGTLSELVQCLRVMGRNDAINLLYQEEVLLGSNTLQYGSRLERSMEHLRIS